jgi:hypothetical protein
MWLAIEKGLIKTPEKAKIEFRQNENVNVVHLALQQFFGQSVTIDKARLFLKCLNRNGVEVAKSSTLSSKLAFEASQKKASVKRDGPVPYVHNSVKKKKKKKVEYDDDKLPWEE